MAPQTVYGIDVFSAPLVFFSFHFIPPHAAHNPFKKQKSPPKHSAGENNFSKKQKFLERERERETLYRSRHYHFLYRQIVKNETFQYYTPARRVCQAETKISGIHCLHASLLYPPLPKLYHSRTRQTPTR